MCPSFIDILDIQSWWEVPSIAHFCSLFRAAFNLLDFDIEELEEALLTDGTEECASSLLTELIVRLLRGCLGNNDISASNYQMFLRRLFRQKCQETGHSNIFNADIDFQFLPLRRKVQILQALCDFRLSADDVFDLLKNLEAESLRVEPLGWDDNASAYWYFYGTRLYREDYVLKTKGKKRKNKDDKKYKKHGDIPEIEEKTERIWQVVCFTEADWIQLTEKFKTATSRVEKDLYLSLSENFLPEIPRLFQEKERLRRKRLLESMPRRTSSRVQTKKQKEEEDNKQGDDNFKDVEEFGDKQKQELYNTEREHRARQRELKRSQSCSSRSGKSRSPSQDVSTRPKQKKKSVKRHGRESDNPDSDNIAQAKPSGRQTNNSLACVTGQILIPDQKEEPHSTRKKIKSSQIFGLLEEDVQTDMYKMLGQLKAHEDAWPFIDPVEEDYAPNYYSVIRRPMDLQRMEDRLDQGYYTDFSMFQSDFNLIVKNCRLYNGQDNEYTEMVDNLETAFNRLAQRYFDCTTSSDDEIAVEYPIRSPPKRQNIKSYKSNKPDYLNNKKRKHDSSDDDDDYNSKPKEFKKFEKDVAVPREKVKIDKFKDTSVREDSDKSDVSQSVELPLASKNKRDGGDKLSSGVFSKKKKKKVKGTKESKRRHKHSSKKNKEKRKHSKHLSKKIKKKKNLQRSSVESLGFESETYSPLHESKESFISNHSETSIDAIFYKDKYDKIKERRRGISKTNCENVCETNKLSEKHKSNTSGTEKHKNPKLKETIDKLKAKSEKSVDSTTFNEYFANSQKKNKKKYGSGELFKSTYQNKNKSDEYEFVDDLDSDADNKNTRSSKWNQKRANVNKSSGSQLSNIKNESATEALEQAVKDISKWLGDTPKLSEFSSNSNSPSQISEEYLPLNPKVDDDVSTQIEKEKSSGVKKDGVRKKLLHKELSKVISRRKEIQRTIERLQPGKTKGNLISNVQLLLKQEDIMSISSNKNKEVKSSTLVKTDDVEGPKLSLGTVLDTVGFGIENQHNFINEAASDQTNKVKVVDTGTMTCNTDEKPVSMINASSNTTDNDETPKLEDEPNKDIVLNPSQEKATPNLSAWFKAFGAPKSGTSKKKNDETDQDDSKSNDVHFDTKNVATADNTKSDQLPAEEAVNSEGGESPIPNLTTSSRPRRTSTGSSVSERSSFSQDLDSPRHQPSHPSPLLRSPASPRTDDHQKNLYPPMNGTVRVGFYQDTASIKSSPEKSCSPREAPQSPYSAYSQHVYAISSNAAQLASQTPGGFNDSSGKSPLPTYAQSYYDSSKAHANKLIRSHDEYPATLPFNSEVMYKQPLSPLPAPFSPVHSTYSQHSQHSPYSHSQHSPQMYAHYPSANVAMQSFDKMSDKNSIFPMKKRSYTGAAQHISESVEHTTPNVTKLAPECGENKKKESALIPSSSYDANNATQHGNNSSYLHGNSTSVIMSSSSSNAQKLQYPNCQMIPSESSFNPSKTVIEDNNLKKAMKEQVNAMRDQYSDISNIQHSIARKQYDFMPMKSFAESEMSKQTMPSNLDMKNSSYVNSAELALINKSSDVITSGYIKSTDVNKSSNAELNLSYLSNENISKVDSMGSLLDNKSHRACDLYNVANMSYAGMVDLNAGQTVGKNIIESMESNPRYAMEKLSSSSQYQNLPLDAIKCISNELVGENLKKPRSEVLPKISYPEGQNLNMKDQGLPEWKADGSCKSSEPSYASYRNIVESDRAGVSETVKSTYESNIIETNESLLKAQCELRVPMCGTADMLSHKVDSQLMSQTEFSARVKNPMSLHVAKPIDTIFSHTSSNSSYKTSNCHSPLSVDPSLRNLSALPQNIDRFKDDRLLSSFQASMPNYEKSIPLAHLYPKNVHNTLHAGNANTNQMFSTPISMAFTRNPLYLTNMQSNIHPLPTMEPLVQEVEKKSRSRKKKNVVEPMPNPNINQSFHAYGGLKTPQPSKAETSPVSMKSGSIVPGSAFNYGPPGNVGLPTLPGSIYPDGTAFLEDLRNSSANSYMATNYIGAVHQRAASDSVEKCPKPDHQSAVHPASNPYRYLTHPQVRPGYPFLSMDPSSPLYQPYIQRQQEELYRHSSSQMMGMFQSGYPTTLGLRQPFNSLTRPPW